VGPGQGNKRHRGTIELTPSRLVAVAWSGRAPASGSDKARRTGAAARGRRGGGREHGGLL
jgi:hypothetical protein